MRIVASARKHGVADEDILHAVAHPLRTCTDQGDFDLVMVVGPARSGVVLIEVGVVDDEDDPRGGHAQPARRKFWP